MATLQEGDHAKFKETLITEEALAKYRAKIGTKLRVHNIIDEVNRLSLRIVTNGIGDPNPLWTDPEYAKKTRYGKNPAPPYFFYRVNPGWVQHGLPGVHAFHSGSDWTILKPALIGDTVTPEITFTGYEEKKSSGFSGRFIMEYQEGKYFNQRKELLASVKGWLVRAERSAARDKGKYSGIQLPHPWTEAELKKVDEDVLAEQVRGAQVRYWEDVKVGEELHPVVKGPLGLTDEIAYIAGGLQAHILSLRNYHEHPSWAFRDPDTYSWEPIGAVHWNKWAAKTAGLPYPYDIGTQRQSWLMNFLSHWMGDEGWLKKNYAEYRKFVYFSDVVWFRGKVTRKYVDQDGEYVVDIETHGWNQRSEDTIPGHSTICLPSKEHKYWPLERRLK